VDSKEVFRSEPLVLRQRDKHFTRKEKVYGQFFTHPLLADFIVRFASLHAPSRERGIDPACGEGVFLKSLLKAGFKEVVGIDIDPEVVNKIPGDIRKQITLVIDNGLITDKVAENSFDIVVGNPPFSAKYGRISDKNILDRYELGRGRRSQAVEVLFLERFIRLARSGGVVGIIIPDGILANTNYEYVRKYIMHHCQILAVISLPRGVFNGSLSTSSKTSVLICRKGSPTSGRVFMAEVDSIYELDRVLKAYVNREEGSKYKWVEVTPETLHPKNYLKQIELPSKYPLVELESLVVDIRTGGTEYGEKRRFVDKGLKYISAKVVTPYGLDFKRDPKYIEPGSIMDKEHAHVKPGDLLFVRVGVGCIGRAAVVIDEEDTGVADDWIYIIRVDQSRIKPEFLAIYLQSPYGRKQVDVYKRGVGTVTIPQKLFLKIKAPLVPLEEQEWFVSRYKDMVKALRTGNTSEAQKIYREIQEKLKRLLEGS